MNVGYSYWGFLGDKKLDEKFNEVSTPDGNAFYSWSIIREIQKRGNKVFTLMSDRDEPGYKKYGRNLFSAWCMHERADAYENMVKFNIPLNNEIALVQRLRKIIANLDLILLEWRFKIPGRNYGENFSQPDWYIQDKILRVANSMNVPVIVFDLDYKLTVEDIAEYKIKSIIELGNRWNGALCSRVEIPFDFDCINEFDVETNKNRIVYVGNRYERDKSVNKYIAKLPCVTVFGNWNESGRDSKARWPMINFKDRISASEMRKAYSEGDSTILLAKDDYYKYGFMTARLIEAIFYGVIPFFPEEFSREVIYKYAGNLANDLTVKSDIELHRKAEELRRIKKEIIAYLREHLKFMDVKNFVDNLFYIKERW